MIEEVKEKMRRLEVPKGFSIRPVLIYVNGVSDHVVAEEFFAKLLISIDSLLMKLFNLQHAKRLKFHSLSALATLLMD